MVRTVIWSLLVTAALSSAGLAAGDPAKGETVFNRCAMCHNANKGGGNGLGPNLFGVVGRNAASVPGFAYSPALRDSKIVWTEDTLRKWVQSPSKVIPGTRMVFAGLRQQQDIDDLVAYLKTRK